MNDHVGKIILFDCLSYHKNQALVLVEHNAYSKPRVKLTVLISYDKLLKIKLRWQKPLFAEIISVIADLQI